MVSHPKEVADIIMAAAEATEAKQLHVSSAAR
jgi:hypothetical protein